MYALLLVLMQVWNTHRHYRYCSKIWSVFILKLACLCWETHENSVGFKQESFITAHASADSLGLGWFDKGYRNTLCCLGGVVVRWQKLWIKREVKTWGQ